MNNDGLDRVDEAMLAEFRDILDLVDPVPEDLAAQVKFALTVQALNAEVAELIANRQLALRNQPTALAQSITFTSTRLSLMVTVGQERDGTVRLDGWVTQGGAAVEVYVNPDPVSLGDLDPSLSIVSDAHGRFSIDGVPRGRVCFVVRQYPDRPDDQPVITPTMEL